MPKIEREQVVIQNESAEALCVLYISLVLFVSFYSYLNLILKSCPSRKYLSTREDEGKQKSIMHDNVVARTKKEHHYNKLWL